MPESIAAAVLLLALFGSSSVAQVVFGPYGHTVTSTPTQQASIDGAVEMMQGFGYSVGSSNIQAALLTDNVPAAWDVNTNTIGIDFVRLEEVISPSTPGAPGHPGCVMILLLHEIMHKPPFIYGKDPCSEAAIADQVAAIHCEIIEGILTAGGGPVDALCQLYKHVQSVRNSFSMQLTLTLSGCGGGSIPNCPACG